MNDIYQILDYEFKDKSLIDEAFTHSSYANENKIHSNERLEFLGDSILGFVISEYLFEHYQKDEGKLSKLKAQIVSANTLKTVIDKLGLFENIKLGTSLLHQPNADFSSIKADLFEAILGAMYLDGGLDCVKKFIFNNLDVEMLIQNLLKNNIDYKTTLQEIVQQDKNSQLKYQDYKLDNLENTFKSEVYINGSLICSGEGKSKKLAQIQAAKKAIQILTKN